MNIVSNLLKFKLALSRTFILSFEITIVAPNGFRLTVRLPVSPTADNIEIESGEEDSIGNKDFDKDLERSGIQ